LDNSQHDKISSDHTHADIRELILQTDAPKDKAMLLILLKISESLEANTQMTHDVSIKLDEHLENYKKHETDDAVRVGSFKTGWRVISGILIILQGVGLMAIKSYSDQNAVTNTAVSQLQMDVKIIQERQNNGLK